MLTFTIQRPSNKNLKCVCPCRIYNLRALRRQDRSANRGGAGIAQEVGSRTGRDVHEESTRREFQPRSPRLKAAVGDPHGYRGTTTSAHSVSAHSTPSTQYPRERTHSSTGLAPDGGDAATIGLGHGGESSMTSVSAITETSPG